MTTPGDPNQPRPGQEPREDGDDYLGSGGPSGPEESGGSAPAGPGTPEPPLGPVPPVVPPPERPRPGGEPRPVPEPEPGGEPPVHPPGPDQPTTPEVPEPTGGRGGLPGDEEPDAETTQAYPVPGGTPAYPGWEGTAEPPPAPPGTSAPSRFEQPSPGEPPGAHGGPPGAPGGAPSGPYAAGAPGAAGPYGEPAPPGTSPSSPYGGPPGGGPYGPMPGPGGYAPPPPGGYPPSYQKAPPGSGLATASLVLGVASPFLVFVCFAGVLTAILSIVFGGVALSRGVGKGRALAGIVISVLALILFTIVAMWFWNVVQDCGRLPGELADQCFRSRFPWMDRPR
ncbi:DUF4190 domain-containing protein [Nonomuraea sp. NPDC050691]|uniref:DUF4190 domain-containing protein n=1 Tax=Nonomuraea sp. NPDC050691 TaxID=3155661 RepID=UPI0033EB982A